MSADTLPDQMAQAPVVYEFQGQQVPVTKQQLGQLQRLDEMRIAILNNDMRGICVTHLLRVEGPGGFYSVNDMTVDLDAMAGALGAMRDLVVKNAIQYQGNAPASNRSQAKN